LQKPFQIEILEQLLEVTLKARGTDNGTNFRAALHFVVVRSVLSRRVAHQILAGTSRGICLFEINKTTVDAPCCAVSDQGEPMLVANVADFERWSCST
jgi:hypothetical protein